MLIEQVGLEDGTDDEQHGHLHDTVAAALADGTLDISAFDDGTERLVAAAIQFAESETRAG